MESFYYKQPKITVDSYNTPTLKNYTNELELDTSFGNKNLYINP